MSYRDPGILIGPPPAMPRRRPWRIYVAAAVGVVVLLLAGSFGMYLSKMAAALKKPLDKAAALKPMEGLPVIEGAQYNEIQTKIQLRVVLPGLPETALSDQAATVVYSAFDYPDFAAAWYDKEMQDRGYSTDGSSDEQTAPASTFEHRYRKRNELVIVHAQRAPNKEDSSLVVMRFTGYKGKE